MNEYCNTENTNIQKRHSQYLKCTVYPVTPPEQWTLGFCEFWNILVFKTGKNYTNAFGGNNANTPNKQQTTPTGGLTNRAPLNCGCGFVSIYKTADQANVSIYIAGCKVFLRHTRLVQSP